jgi:HlyD family secretion protein
MRTAYGIALLVAAQLAACNPGPAPSPGNSGAGRDIVKVTGELRSANSRFFGPPAVHNIWQYTISFMAPDGSRVQARRPILGFDTQELTIKIRDKNNKLNQKQKELQKQEILARETLAEGRLAVEEARALVDKAALKAEIPESLLAGRDYREYQLVLQQSKLTLALRKLELEKEIRVQETESEILRREIAVLDAEVVLLQSSIDSMTIMAPADGMVIHVISRHGNKVAVGDDVWGGRRVLEFPDLSQLELHLEIPERESARITVGQAVQFTLDAAPDRLFEGQVVELASVIHTKSINQPAKVFDAVIALQNPDPELMRPGMSVNAEIQMGRETEAGT